MFHRSDHVQIWRQEKLLLSRFGFGCGVWIRQAYGPRGASLVTLKQQHRFAKNLSEVPPIDLINNEHVRNVWISLGALGEPVWRSVLDLEASGRVRAISSHEMFVRI